MEIPESRDRVGFGENPEAGLLFAFGMLLIYTWNVKLKARL